MDEDERVEGHIRDPYHRVVGIAAPLAFGLKTSVGGTVSRFFFQL